MRPCEHRQSPRRPATPSKATFPTFGEPGAALTVDRCGAGCIRLSFPVAIADLILCPEPWRMAPSPRIARRNESYSQTLRAGVSHQISRDPVRSAIRWAKSARKNRAPGAAGSSGIPPRPPAFRLQTALNRFRPQFAARAGVWALCEVPGNVKAKIVIGRSAEGGPSQVVLPGQRRPGGHAADGGSQNFACLGISTPTAKPDSFLMPPT
jgi:hypothetical protein